MRIKSPLCCRLHHDPMSRGVCVCSDQSTLVCSCGWPCSVVALRIELSAPWLSAEDGRPALDYRCCFSSSYGNRTHLSALKGQCPLTDRRTSRVVCALPARTVGREALESSSADFQAAARPSQLPDRTQCARKKPAADDSGLGIRIGWSRVFPGAACQQRNGCVNSVCAGKVAG